MYIEGSGAALFVSKYEIKTYKRNTSTYLPIYPGTPQSLTLNVFSCSLSLSLSFPLNRRPDPVLDEYLQQYPEWVQLKHKRYQ